MSEFLALFPATVELALCAIVFALLLGSQDHHEGLAAVTEKRAPVFRGE